MNDKTVIFVIVESRTFFACILKCFELKVDRFMVLWFSQHCMEFVTFLIIDSHLKWINSFKNYKRLLEMDTKKRNSFKI